MLDLADGPNATAVAGQKPVLSEQGSTSGDFRLTNAPKDGQAIVTVSCGAAGRFQVEGDGSLLLDSKCTGRASASIALPWKEIGTKIHVSAPGGYWLTIVPTTS